VCLEAGKTASDAKQSKETAAETGPKTQNSAPKEKRRRNRGFFRNL
jgi:hypothetical protein